MAQKSQSQRGVSDPLQMFAKMQADYMGTPEGKAFFSAFFEEQTGGLKTKVDKVVNDIELLKTKLDDLVSKQEQATQATATQDGAVEEVKGSVKEVKASLEKAVKASSELKERVDGLAAAGAHSGVQEEVKAAVEQRISALSFKGKLIIPGLVEFAVGSSQVPEQRQGNVSGEEEGGGWLRQEVEGSIGQREGQRGGSGATGGKGGGVRKSSRPKMPAKRPRADDPEIRKGEGTQAESSPHIISSSPDEPPAPTAPEAFFADLFASYEAEKERTGATSSTAASKSPAHPPSRPPSPPADDAGPSTHPASPVLPSPGKRGKARYTLEQQEKILAKLREQSDGENKAKRQQKKWEKDRVYQERYRAKLKKLKEEEKNKGGASKSSSIAKGKADPRSKGKQRAEGESEQEKTEEETVEDKQAQEGEAEQEETQQKSAEQGEAEEESRPSASSSVPPAPPRRVLDDQLAEALMGETLTTRSRALTWVVHAMHDPGTFMRIRRLHPRAVDRMRVIQLGGTLDEMQGIYNDLYLRRGETVHVPFHGRTHMSARELYSFRRLFWLAARAALLSDWRFTQEQVMRFLTTHVPWEDYLALSPDTPILQM